MWMALVNQSHRLIAILLQSPLYKLKMEDLVTIRNKLFVSSSMDPLLILIQLEVLILTQLKKKFVSRFHNPIFFFSIYN